jgi:hypothetical protein
VWCNEASVSCTRKSGILDCLSDCEQSSCPSRSVQFKGRDLLYTRDAVEAQAVPRGLRPAIDKDGWRLAAEMTGRALWPRRTRREGNRQLGGRSTGWPYLDGHAAANREVKECMRGVDGGWRSCYFPFCFKRGAVDGVGSASDGELIKPGAEAERKGDESQRPSASTLHLPASNIHMNSFDIWRRTESRANGYRIRAREIGALIPEEESAPCVDDAAIRGVSKHEADR